MQQHIYNGKCPDSEQPDSFDPDCAACMAQFCRWSVMEPEYEMSVNYETGCRASGNAHTFIDGGIFENDYKFCPYCGKLIEAV